MNLDPIMMKKMKWKKRKNKNLKTQKKKNQNNQVNKRKMKTKKKAHHLLVMKMITSMIKIKTLKLCWTLISLKMLIKKK